MIRNRTNRVRNSRSSAVAKEETRSVCIDVPPCAGRLKRFGCRLPCPPQLTSIECVAGPRRIWELSNRIDWYVTDDRGPLREVRSSNSERVVAGRPDFQKRMSELLKEARLDGIRPMPIDALLSFLSNGAGSQALNKR